MIVVVTDLKEIPKSCCELKSGRYELDYCPLMSTSGACILEPEHLQSDQTDYAMEDNRPAWCPLRNVEIKTKEELITDACKAALAAE